MDRLKDSVIHSFGDRVPNRLWVGFGEFLK